MKLRSITLTEVRQFIAPVRVAGIGDGVNVLAEPNESGKSTLFDALHYLFFVKHTTQVGNKSFTLQPSAGGDPQVEVEVEVDGALLTLRKKWGRGKFAEVRRDGVTVALRDEAEAMISALTQAPDAGGPAGLLWVRQGITEFDHKDEKSRKSREDLITSVTGEFEALTGGKRMDKALARAREELDRLVTSRGARAGGPLEAAEREVRELEAKVAVLRDRAASLQGALDARRKTRKALATLQDPEEIAHRAGAQARAEAAFAAAESHALKVEASASARASTELALATLRKEIEARGRVGMAVETLTRRLAEAATKAGETRAREAAELAGESATAEALAAAQAAREAAEAKVTEALTASAQREATARRARLGAALDEALVLAQRMPGLRKAATTGPEPRALEGIDRAARDLAVAEELARTAAPHLSFAPLPGAPALLLNGAPLDATPRPVAEPATLDLPGLGTLRLDPGTSASVERLAASRKAMAAALAGTGAETPEAARAAARARVEAVAALREAEEAYRRLAPEGIDALKAEHDRLPAEAPEPPDRAAAEAEAGAARAAESEARARREAARAGAQAAREAAILARHDHEALTARLEEAKAALAALPGAAGLDLALAEATEAFDRAEKSHQLLVAQAPDLAASRAALQRARGAVRQAEDEAATLASDLAGYSATIAALSGEGVEADLAEATERLTQALATREAHQREVAVLRALIAALEAARAAARDRYFEPVLGELRPMLRLLWPGAELNFDGDSLLPGELIRDGKAEPIGSLSGGTREQISLLVRLAFARLLARSGRHAPVILDDALVYTDDTRMEAMFDALTLQASDLQILVLSCRNRALRDLGGRKLHFEPVAAPA